MTIETAGQRDEIVRILETVGLHDCLVEFVESVQEWARSVGVIEENPFRAAMALRADGRPLIVLISQISAEQRQGILGGMLLRGFGKELEQLESAEMFLEHLVLHEAAHL